MARAYDVSGGKRRGRQGQKRPWFSARAARRAPSAWKWDWPAWARSTSSTATRSRPWRRTGGHTASQHRRAGGLIGLDRALPRARGRGHRRQRHFRWPLSRRKRAAQRRSGQHTAYDVRAGRHSQPHRDGAHPRDAPAGRPLRHRGGDCSSSRPPLNIEMWTGRKPDKAVMFRALAEALS